MKKRNLMTAVGAGVIGAGAVSYFLMNDKQKSKIKESVNKMIGKQMESEEHTIERAGHPDQLDYRDEADLENAKMVSEGSQFGVQYYNEHQEHEEYLQ